jgi:Uma2 family endonuclease
MPTMTLPRLITTEELLAMPDDGVERWIVNGELRENRGEFASREKPMTIRNRFHSRLVAKVAYYLMHWQASQKHSPGEVVAGEAGFRLCNQPETTVGADVAFVSREVMERQGTATTLIEGPPVLAVEILSPSDTQQDIHEKIKLYLEAGTKLVWIIDPDYKTITAFESGKSPVFFNQEQTLTAEPHLPGFSVAVADLFG